MIQLDMRKEQERVRPEIKEKVQEEPLLEAFSSQTTPNDKVECTKKLVHVNHMTGRLSIFVDIDQSCSSLKKLVENRLRYSLENFSLRFGGKLLDNRKALNSYGISHNSILDLYPKLLGGCERDQTLPEFIHTGIVLKRTVTIPDPYVQHRTQHVQDLNDDGCRLAKSLVDIFMSAFGEGKTWAGLIEMTDFKVHFGRAEVTKPPTGGWTFDAWRNDCKKLASILRSNVSDTMTRNGQNIFRTVVNNVPCKPWQSAAVQSAYIFKETKQQHSGRTGSLPDSSKSFECFRFQRNFTKHASEEKVNGISRFSWTILDYVIAYVLKDFVPQVIKKLLENGLNITELLQAAVPF